MKDCDTKYWDIINLPHPVSSTRPRMSLHDRAAQFSPFAALTGHEEAIEETARLTDDKLELDESSKEIINEALNRMQGHLREYPDRQMKVQLTYFVPDERKSGGSYKTITGIVKKIREYEQQLVFTDETVVPFEHIISIRDNKNK